MRIHFIGIGGIGVSALAKYYLEKGHEISGSDLAPSEITDALKKMGAKIIIPHQNKFSMGQVGKHKLPDLVVYSPAVPEDNPELKDARKHGIKCQSYPEALGKLTKTHFTIAVSGTHGKSTTTAMIGILLTSAGLDPTVIVGTKLKEFSAQGGLASGEGSNCRVGKSKRLVIEADEHFASFLNYWPKIIVLTAIEKDHLDYYKNLKNILKTFGGYINHLSQDGWLVANKDDKNIFQLAKNRKQKTIFYSLKQPEEKEFKKILKIPGEHNVSNALAALTVARLLKIPDEISFKALSKYKGAWRRFEIHQKTVNSKQITVVSDYGHHPTEVFVTLKAAREKFKNKKIWCIFQPHQYQRTFYLFKNFIKLLRQARNQLFVDKLIITDIYDVAGREDKEIKRRVSAQKLVKAIKKQGVIYLPQNKIINYLKKNLKGGEVVIIMGAGDIYKISKNLQRTGL